MRGEPPAKSGPGREARSPSSACPTPPSRTSASAPSGPPSPTPGSSTRAAGSPSSPGLHWPGQAGPRRPAQGGSWLRSADGPPGRSNWATSRSLVPVADAADPHPGHRRLSRGNPGSPRHPFRDYHPIEHCRATLDLDADLPPDDADSRDMKGYMSTQDYQFALFCDEVVDLE